MKLTFAASAFLLSLRATAYGSDVEPTSWDGNYLATFEVQREQRDESFRDLIQSSVPSGSVAKELASEYWFRGHGLLAEESETLTGLFRIGRDINEFAAKGDWVWEVRVLHLAFRVDGIIWVNARTKQIRAIGP